MASPILAEIQTRNPISSWLAYRDFVNSRAKHLPTRKERVAHALLGIIGECGELADTWKKHTIYIQTLDTKNIREELGDLRFYIQMFFNEGAEYSEHMRASIEASLTEEGLTVEALLAKIVSTGGDFNTFVLINDAQGIPTNQGVNHSATSMLSAYQELCALFEADEYEIMAENVSKLEARYPTGYSDALAAARLDKVGDQ